MPEVSEGMNRNSAENVATGFWIRRPAYPIGLRRSRSNNLQNFMSPTDNKENIPPTTARHLARQRKSPLPHWYPRTPLRDITVVINALQRRKMRSRATNAQQRNSNPEELSIGGPVADDELNASEHTPITQVLPFDVSDNSPSLADTPISQILPSDVSDTSPSPSDRSFSSVTPLGNDMTTPSCSNVSTTEHPSCSESVSSKTSTEDPKSVEYEKKLQKIIEELELVVKEKLKMTPKKPVQKSTRILMSMR
ncbi:protein POLYCHOME-like [Zingiber officinale]|uniref:Uncharacterized protein n=1 Tax=Zingiber officinale TaxID=94328 RepID=A0A8J5G132_ZINOF|nr:protein POLYCHOME-like [Zingiber officinale]XP_042414215.1 protein POLYCHOME-like [Zingiber officinale]XP_042414216.1 protein POLYCHOME-like [Zingiber officinale]KAG6494361.1 hypothetical protein ZIOFF_049386 [Zingiber officinale]